jgi:hypothetical protein
MLLYSKGVGSLKVELVHHENTKEQREAKGPCSGNRPKAKIAISWIWTLCLSIVESGLTSIGELDHSLSTGVCSLGWIENCSSVHFSAGLRILENMVSPDHIPLVTARVVVHERAL